LAAGTDGPDGPLEKDQRQDQLVVTVLTTVLLQAVVH